MLARPIEICRPRRGGGAVRSPRDLRLEALEPRTLLSSVQLGADLPAYLFTEADGDQVTVALRGPGSATLDLDDAERVLSIDLQQTTAASRLDVRVKRAAGGDGTTRAQAITGSGVGQLHAPALRLVGSGLQLDFAPARVSLFSLENGADLSLGQTPRPTQIHLQQAIGVLADPVALNVPSGIHKLTILGRTAHLDVQAQHLHTVKLQGEVVGLDLRTQTLRKLSVSGDTAMLRDSRIAAADDIGDIDVRGHVHDTLILAGAVLPDDADLADGTFDNAAIASLRVTGDLVDSIVGAGVNPGPDGLFSDGDILDGGSIRRLVIDGLVVGADSVHPNPGVYAAQIGRVKLNGVNYQSKDPLSLAASVIGTAVIDPLPTPGVALELDDIEEILARAARRAEQLGVNATISLVDREGNLLAVVRTNFSGIAPAATTVDIEAGGLRGLEAVDGIVSTSLIAATKAGTAAFLSTGGNAFTTRTAGYIIQKNFPPGVRLQDSGPLFGVQLSSLPTSDINRLPLGLSADPGGLPLYRGGQVVAGIGVEVDGVYTVDPARVGGSPTTEELIALAGQIGLEPPAAIRADRITVDGIRLAYANAKPPALARLGDVPDYDDSVAASRITELLAPAVSPATKFATSALTGGINGKSRLIAGEVPNNALADFFNDGTGEFTFLDGDSSGGEQLTAAEVERILLQGHALNQNLRAQIRRDRPQRSQVTVSVVDLNGNLLGAFRTPDAPVFGYDVSVQKARTAAFFSRPDANAQLRELDTEVNLDPLQDLNYVDPTVNDPFGQHMDAAEDIGVLFDGSVAVADRTGGFLARPNLPDGINGTPAGPLSIQGTDQFSPFNTGIQTLLIAPKLVEFLLAFNTAGEAAGLAAFRAGTLGGGGVVPSEANGGGGTLNPGGGLNDNSLANGMQIFAGSVPLYKNGQLVGAVGVSGDGIEQDDFVAFTAATGFQEFPDNVRRADEVFIAGGIRLPYVKLPRVPFGGL